MKRKRIKYVANIDFGYRSITDAKQYIKIFLKSLLSQIGLQLGMSANIPIHTAIGPNP